jgi:hypothetical protein
LATCCSISPTPTAVATVALPGYSNPTAVRGGPAYDDTARGGTLDIGFGQQPTAHDAEHAASECVLGAVS